MYNHVHSERMRSRPSRHIGEQPVLFGIQALVLPVDQGWNPIRVPNFSLAEPSLDASTVTYC